MVSLEQIIAQLPPAPRGAALLAEFVPPSRFAGKHFDGYRPDPDHPSQRAALERVAAFARDLQGADGWFGRVRTALVGRRVGGGIYLDGGFGVGKTHLLAALWNAAPAPKAYLSFDELVFTIGLLGVAEARSAFRDQTLVCVDEWELDDPGNLKLALAFLRGAVADGVQVAVTSNTLPDELGRGRFSQKDFALEIEELAAAFEVVGIRGEDFRHRQFETAAGREYSESEEALKAEARATPGALLEPFPRLLAGLAGIHPIRYASVVDAVAAVLVTELSPIEALPDALRWVHFVDKLYDAAVPLGVSSADPLGALFQPESLRGPYGKKMSRCLSRMEELLGERRARSAPLAALPTADQTPRRPTHQR